MGEGIFLVPQKLSDMQETITKGYLYEIMRKEEKLDMQTT